MNPNPFLGSNHLTEPVRISPPPPPLLEESEKYRWIVINWALVVPATEIIAVGAIGIVVVVVIIKVFPFAVVAMEDTAIFRADAAQRGTVKETIERNMVSGSK
jgi:hypothetical protein